MRVLLVDDERKFVSVLAKRLRMRGYDADYAFTGEDALSLARDTIYDVMVLDVKMPGIGGLELKAKLEELNPDSRCIFVTGHGSLEACIAHSGEDLRFTVRNAIRLLCA